MVVRREHERTPPAQTSAEKLPNHEEVAQISVYQDFSQHGEQQIILDFFSRLQHFPKYCVDAGAYDGFVGSNSRALFLSGWSGVAIEPNPRAFARLRELYADRPDVKCVQKAVSTDRREAVPMKFSVGPPGIAEEDKWKYAQPSTLHDSFASEYERDHGYIYETLPVSVDTLPNILRDVGAPKDIGFLSIDCEGEDINIVRSLDLQAWRPLLICIEAEDGNRHFYSELLEPRGYAVHDHTPANTFFRLEDSPPA